MTKVLHGGFFTEGSPRRVLHGGFFTEGSRRGVLDSRPWWTLVTCTAAVAMLWVAGCGKPAPTPEGTSRPTTPAASAGAPQPAPAAAAPLPRDVVSVLEAYRKIIVLLEDDRALEPADQERAEIAGRLLYQQKHQDVSALSDALADELRAKPPVLARTTVFLDALESHPELHDADKLAFADVLDALSEAAPGVPGPAGDRLRARLTEDIAALREIQALYQRELQKIFGRFETRGIQVRREAWEAYVAFLRTRYQPKPILESYEGALRQVTATRGSRAAENPLETTGSRLPLKALVLTFDDGPHVTRTDQIIAILKRFGVKAVFFQVGQNVATGPRETRATRASAAGRHVVDAGYAIGNHSYSHELLPKLSDRELAEDLERTNKALASESPDRITLFRPPYGARNQKVLAAVQARQMKSVLWNIDSKDWADPIPLSIANRVVQAVDGEKRGILLFHDIQRQTVEALPTILETLQARGYRFLAWNGSDFVDENAGTAPLAAQEAPAPALYRESWAVVVGIDAYERWPKLSFAANDARAIRDLLTKKFEFKADHVTVLLNEEATRAKIMEVLGDRLSDSARVKKDDRVFVFFAGHGATRALPNGRSLGYIVPVDADVTNYQSQAISMTNFQDISDAIPAKHVLFVTDACYGGLIVTRGGSQSYLQQVTRRMARQILTAGGADEEVADTGPNGHSIFTWTLMQGLDGRGDLNGDGFITASELAAYTGPIVSSISRQTPAFGALPGSEGGEFVFQLSHETEFLSEASAQLDEEGIKLNAELERLRAVIAEKRARNEKLRSQISSARAEAGGSAPAAPAPPTSAAANDRGMLLFREKKYAEALAAFEDAAKRAPGNPLAANNVGYMYYKLGKYPEATEWFERTLRLDPKRAIAYGNLGDAYLAVQKYPQARTAYEKYLKLQPNGAYAASVRAHLREVMAKQ